MTGYQPESSERQSALRRKADAARAPDHAPTHPLLTLQSQIGNANVARLLAQRDEQEEKPELAAKHDLTMQRDTEDDKPPEVGAKHDLTMQRDDDDTQAMHDLAQREEDVEAVGVEGGEVGPDTAQRISAARGGGSSLDSGTRGTMEAGFGTSFEDVRVHQDSESDVLARRLTSHAFTTGSDIFLRNDASPSDSHLIAHELTHVVQQRSMTGGGSMSVGSADDAHESHADAMASTVLSGAAAPTAVPAGAQRDTDEDKISGLHDMSLQRDAEEED